MSRGGAAWIVPTDGTARARALGEGIADARTLSHALLDTRFVLE